VLNDAVKRIREVGTPASTVIICGTVLLFIASALIEPSSLKSGALKGMLPFAAVLAIIAIGQTLVVQQAGIDLSVPGMVSLVVVIMTHYPAGDSSKLPAAILISFGVAIAAGLLAGFIVSKVGITAIVTTLGMNALLFGLDIKVSHGGLTQATTPDLQHFASGSLFGIQSSVLIAIAITAIVAVLVKLTVVGRRFEAVGANPAAARASGITPGRYQIGAYVGANILYCCAAILLAGIIHSPSAFQGETYLLPSVAAVVLGGTSLLGGKGSVVATAIGALFLTQLDQFVLTTGINAAVQYLVQALALAAGVAIYIVPWGRVRKGLNDTFAGGRGGPSTENAAPT
jgi:ribose transport system permease protein